MKVKFYEEKLGTEFKHKHSEDVFELRQMPIINNTAEPRVRYLWNKKLGLRKDISKHTYTTYERMS